MPQTKKFYDRICIIGLGYVGLTLAVAMANAGYRIHGVEKKEYIRNCIENGKAHFSETGLDELLAEHVGAGRITCSAELPEAGTASVYIVTVGTPLTNDGMADLSALEIVLGNVAGILRDDDTVVLRSTVKTGTTNRIAKRILDEAGKNYFLAFCPERTLEGKALQELTSLPQIVGGINERSTERAAKIFSALAPKIIRVDNPEAAEMIKLVNNTHRDMMFAFSNEVAEMCDAVGVSAIQVIKAACEDYPRSDIAMPGPVGGPCLEKDPHILAEGLRETGYIPRLSLAGRRLNEELPRSSMHHIAQYFEKLDIADLGKEHKISILGLAFKGQPETNDVRGTMAAHILEAARARWPQASYYGFDPVVASEELDRFNLTPCTTLAEAFEDASLVLIQNNHKDFANMPIESLMSLMSKPSVVYDYWNLFYKSKLALPPQRYYTGLGTISASAGSASNGKKGQSMAIRRVG